MGAYARGGALSRQSSRVGGRRRDHRQRLGGDRVDDLLLGLDRALVVLAVAEHSEVRALPAVPMDRDARQDLLALLQAKALHVEVRKADPVGRVRRVLAVVRRHGLREPLEVLGDLGGVSHRSGERVAPRSPRWVSASSAGRMLGAASGATPVAARTRGATSVANSSVACIAFAWGSTPTLM